MMNPGMNVTMCETQDMMNCGGEDIMMKEAANNHYNFPTVTVSPMEETDEGHHNGLHGQPWTKESYDCLKEWRYWKDIAMELATPMGLMGWQYYQILDPSDLVCDEQIEMSADNEIFIVRNGNKVVQRIAVITDCSGGFLGRLYDGEDESIRWTVNQPFSSLGFELEDKKHLRRGWLYEYLDNDPTHIVFLLYLENEPNGVPYASICLPWTKETRDFFYCHIDPNGKWCGEAPDWKCYPVADNNMGPGWQCGNAYIGLDDIVENLNPWIMVWRDVTKKELARTAVFKYCTTGKGKAGQKEFLDIMQDRFKYLKSAGIPLDWASSPVVSFLPAT